LECPHVPTPAIAVCRTGHGRAAVVAVRRGRALPRPDPALPDPSRGVAMDAGRGVGDLRRGRLERAVVAAASATQATAAAGAGSRQPGTAHRPVARTRR